MLNKERIFQIIDFVVNEAKGYDTRVLVRSTVEGLTRFANSEIHQNTYEDKTEVTITILEGKKRSEITTTTYDDEGLSSTVKEAIANLAFLPEGVLELPLVDSPESIESNTFSEELDSNFDVVARAKLVKAGLDMLDPGYIAYGALTYKIHQIAFGNSKEVKRFSKSNNVDFSVLIASEAGGSSYTELTSTRVEDLDIVGAFKKVYERAQMNQNPVELEPGAYTVILEPMAVGDLVTYMAYVGFSGKSVQNRISFLTGKKGEKVFGDNITIVDDYTNENSFNLPFDFEGFPRQQVSIIENGVAKDLVYDQATAIIDGVENTGHSINRPSFGGFPLSMVMNNGDKPLEEIIKETANGLLVTRFHYMNVVNPRQAVLTALTRDGVFKIENGKIVGAVKNMRFTDNMFDVLNNVTAISSDRQSVPSFFASNYVPAIRVNNFHFTGKTNA